MKKRYLLPALVALAPALALPAQAAIAPDRPSVAIAPSALEAGILQLEIGSRFAGGATPAVGFEATQRFGLIPGLELRMTTPLQISAAASDSSVSLGAKAQFLEGYLLSLGALGTVTLSPKDRPAMQGAFLGTLGLPAGFSLTVNLGPAYGASVEWLGAACLSFASGNLWQAYGEVARYQDAAGSGTGWGADAGLQVLITEDVSWDVAVLRGLSPEVPDWAVTSGVSWRWGAR